MSGAGANGGGRELPGFFGAEQPPAGPPLDQEIWSFIDAHLESHPGGAERLIPLLHRVQEKLGFLPYEVQEYVADKMGLSPVQVFGVVSFYHWFTTTPRARYRIRVCMGTACYVDRAEELLATLEAECEVEPGGISPDGLFNLDRVRCIGACGLGPVVLVNDDVYGAVTPALARRLVRQLRTEAEREREREQEQPAEETE